MHNGFKPIYQPDLWPTQFYPTTELLVAYQSSTVQVSYGHVLKPSTVEHPPTVQHSLRDDDDTVTKYQYR